jgi:MFS superfamily sulfate permease-like transporter
MKPFDGRSRWRISRENRRYCTNIGIAAAIGAFLNGLSVCGGMSRSARPIFSQGVRNE